MRKNITIAEIHNNIFTIQECSIHERGNKNEIIHKFERQYLATIASSMKLSIIIFILWNCPKWFLRISNIFSSTLFFNL